MEILSSLNLTFFFYLQGFQLIIMFPQIFFNIIFITFALCCYATSFNFLINLLILQLPKFLSMLKFQSILFSSNFSFFFLIINPCLVFSLWNFLHFLFHLSSSLLDYLSPFYYQLSFFRELFFSSNKFIFSPLKFIVTWCSDLRNKAVNLSWWLTYFLG